MEKRMTSLPTTYQGKTSGLWCSVCNEFHDFAAAGCKVVNVVWTALGYVQKR